MVDGGGFTSVTELDSHGWGPLFYAVIGGRADVAAHLLDLGAKVEATLRKSEMSFNGFKGTSILSAAAPFRTASSPRTQAP